MPSTVQSRKPLLSNLFCHIFFANMVRTSYPPQTPVLSFEIILGTLSYKAYAFQHFMNLLFGLSHHRMPNESSLLIHFYDHISRQNQEPNSGLGQSQDQSNGQKILVSYVSPMNIKPSLIQICILGPPTWLQKDNEMLYIYGSYNRASKKSVFPPLTTTNQQKVKEFKRVLYTMNKFLNAVMLNLI